MTESSAPVLLTVTGPRGPGRLSTMVRPRGYGLLAADMAALRGAGADILVCALPDAERAELGLTDEPRLAEAAGLRFVALPVPDFTVPSIPVVLPALRELAAELRAGAHVVAHCRCAIGRSSLIAVSLMILLDIAPEAAWTAMERARGTRVPDTEEQRAWTLEFYRLVSAGRQRPGRPRAAGVLERPSPADPQHPSAR
ncbi:tyrosine protein phosphatase [Streptomyces sp. NPDC048581]|uniref:phosphatase domain-containing putative toxin n=1 Tax=Streptomyces sp. NPDC048581 TaxID=3365572 RepID=UPI00371C0302